MSTKKTLSHTWVIKKDVGFGFVGLSSQIDHKTWAKATVTAKWDLICSLDMEWISTSKECSFSILKSKSDRKVLLTKKATEVEKVDNVVTFQTKFDNLLDKYNELTIYVHAVFCTEDFQDVNIAPISNLHEGMQSLREDETFVDMTISCEGETFKVHKAVLAAQSPVLRKMFQVDMKEKQTSVVEMKDVSPAVVSDLLAYLYTGEAPNIKTFAKELLTVAHKYEIPKLLRMCQKQLKANLEISNVLELYFFSKLYNDGDLTEACKKLLSLNLTDLSSIPGWDDLAHGDEIMLLRDILSCFAS